jgi:DNA-nicking Smr family endonuclease
LFDSKKLSMEIANGEKEETGSLEFKSHLGTANPQQYEVNQDGHSRYRIDTEKLTFKGIKELQQYFHFVNCIKPVCAFLNTKGGVLAIGFKDFLNENGMREATGLINETEKDEDTFQKEVLDILESKFQRSVVNNFIEVFIERVGSKKVCLIKVDKTDDVVFVEKFKVLGSTSKEPTLFVRSGNSSRELTDPIDLYHHGKVQGNKRGQVSEKPSQEKDYEVPIDLRLDLHGMTAARAHKHLIQSILLASDDGCRCVLVITGKGSGVLNGHVPNWLKQPPLSFHVLALAEAPPKDGGSGAFYVLLRRKRNMKLHTAEISMLEEYLAIQKYKLKMNDATIQLNEGAQKRHEAELKRHAVEIKLSELRDSKHEKDLEGFNTEFAKTRDAEKNRAVFKLPNDMNASPFPQAEYGWGPKVQLISTFDCLYAGLVLIFDGGIAVWGQDTERFEPARVTQLEELQGYVGCNVQLNRRDSHQEPAWGSSGDFLSIDQLRPAFEKKSTRVPRVFIELEDLREITKCAPRTVKNYWNHPDGAYRIDTKDDVFYSFRLPSRIVAALWDFPGHVDDLLNSTNPFVKWEKKHLQHMRQVSHKKGEKLGFEAIVVQFEGIKIITIVAETLADPKGVNPLVTGDDIPF